MSIISETLYEKIFETANIIGNQINNAKLSTMFKNCYLNTLTTTTKALDDGTFFIITGDIDAMWLRDSTSQIKQYLPLAKYDPEVRRLFKGVIKRQIFYISIDPYANAFNESDNGRGHQDDITKQTPWIWERKYEIDSLCYPVELIYSYWKISGDLSVFNDAFKHVICLMLSLWKTEQKHEENSTYSFMRKDCQPSDTLQNKGKGAPVAFTGMSWSAFRPSDDANMYGYNIPANMFLAVALRYIEEIVGEIYGDAKMQATAAALRNDVESGIQKYGIVNHPEFGRIYAYETDGLGHCNLMDDANVPDLLSIPYFGYRGANEGIYTNTKRFVLSKSNPYFFEGKHAKGVGSPHTPNGYVWHIGLIMQALTSEDEDEIRQLLDMIIRTDAGTGYMHESFHVDDPCKFTRSWFAWANSLFAQLILQLVIKGFDFRLLSEL